MSIQTYKIGDTIKLTKELKSNSIDLIITSPPYWSLRDYGVNGQIGLESSLEEYHGKLLILTSELYRVLKSTGIMFWIHGDNYPSGGGKSTETSYNRKYNIKTNSHPDNNPSAKFRSSQGKCMMLQNERLIIKMIDDQGWILRNRIIWNKPSCMPFSGKDRLTNKYEPIYMLTKNKNYYFNLDSIRQPHSKSSIKRISQNNGHPVFNGNKKRGHPKNQDTLNPKQFCHPLGKNPGDVWTIPTQSYKDSHFATFPLNLIKPIIKCGCPKNGIVLDPFLGSGTTLEACRKLDIDGIGFELNPKYEKLIKQRAILNIPQLDKYS